MKRDNAYYPNALATNKYGQYFRYLYEFLKYKDFASIKSSFRFVANGIPEKNNRIANSALGKFHIRKGTTDFQFINYAYEREIRNYLIKNIKNFEVFIDVGACIGEYCVWLASKGKNCYAFEPVEQNFKSLQANVDLNNLNHKISTYNFGLGAKEEEVTFEVMNTVTGSSHINRSEKTINGATINIKKIDDILSEDKIQNDTPVILKMDVEGMELEVLKGGSNFFKRMNNIRLIYEHSFSGDKQIQNLIKQFGEFEFRKLDKYNILAYKV